MKRTAVIVSTMAVGMAAAATIALEREAAPLLIFLLIEVAGTVYLLKARTTRVHDGAIERVVSGVVLVCACVACVVTAYAWIRELLG